MGGAGSGRPGRPTSLKLLRGERRDRVNTSEPVPSGPVEPPEGLSAAALEVWRRLAPDLEHKGVLTAWDSDAFAVVCDAVARLRRAAAALDEAGPTATNRHGERVVSPWFRVWLETSAVLARFGARFGLSPADRQRLVVGDAAPPADDLLSQ